VVREDSGVVAVAGPPNILRTDRHMHRPLPAKTEHALAIKALARQHEEAIWALHQTVSRLRSVLLEFYPQASRAFPKLKHHAATTVLAAAPTPAAGMRLTRRRVEALLHKCGRRNDAALVEQIVTDLKTPALRQPERVEAALGLTVQGLVDIISAMRASVETLEAELAASSSATPWHRCFVRRPGSARCSPPGCWPSSVTTRHASHRSRGCAPSPARHR
jgi:hypothetical protein